MRVSKSKIFVTGVILLFLSFYNCGFAQSLVIGDGAEITVEGVSNSSDSDAVFAVGGGLIVENNGILRSVNDARYYVSGDITYEGDSAFIAGSSILTLNGSASQQITNSGGSSNLFVYDLIIDNASGVTLSHSGASQTVVSNVLSISNGTLTTNDDLTIQADSLNGNIVYGRIAAHAPGGISGNATIKKRLTNSDDGWRQLSFPVQGTFGTVAQNDITLLLNTHTPAAQRSVYIWDATGSGTGDYANGWTEASSSDGANQAFTAYLSGTNGIHTVGPSPSEPVFNFFGIPNSGDFNTSLEYNRDPADTPATAGADPVSKGWNFIANPWPAMVDIDTMLGDATNFTSAYKAVHVWNAVSQQYSAILANGLSKDDYNTGGPNYDRTGVNIPPMQGFWVRATNTSQVVNLVESNMRTTDLLSTPDFMSVKPDLFRVDVYDSDSAWDQLTVYFSPNSTRGFDYVGDAYYLKSFNAGVPGIIGLEGTEPASIIARPVNFEDSIEVRVESVKNQSKFFMHTYLDELNTPYDIYIKDRATGKIRKMKAGGSFEFTHDSNYSGNRFVIFYTQNTVNLAELNQNIDKANVLNYAKDGQLYIKSLGYTGNADVIVSDVIGRVLLKKSLKLTKGDEQQLELESANRIILVSIKTDTGVTTNKMFY